MTLETWPSAKESTFELRQIDFFSTAVDSSWWAGQSTCHPFFDRKIPSWNIPVWKLKGVDNFSSEVHTETKNRPIPKWYQMCLLNFKSSFIAKEIEKEFILCSFLSDDVRNLAYGKRVNFWTKTDRFFFTAVDSSLWADRNIGYPFFSKKFLHEIYQFESLKG